VGRFWSLLFLLVPILGVWIFLSAAINVWPFSGGAFAFPVDHWLPQNVNPHGEIIDILFMRILYLTGAIFIGTGIALFWFMWKYDTDKNTEPVKFSHGNHTLEIVWSILPAATLLFIAVYQMNAWADHKMVRPDEPTLAVVTGRQFEWRIRYAGDDGELFTRDDVHTVNDLHVPVGRDIVLQIESQDVLHSFFLPNLRVKQDVVPGMTQFVWFKADKAGAYDIVCAELCGWGHYKMRGLLTVESESQFNSWLAEQYQEQELDRFEVEKD
jgi:cytochrome c oxidase subunit 2